MIAPRLRVSLLSLAFLAACVAGCGSKFDLPTEQPAGKPVPSDQSYAMIATWKNLDGIQDILLTQGAGSQLFLLFNHGGTGGPQTPRGEVKLYSFANPIAIGAPFFDAPRTLFNPVALCSSQNRLFVLDQGDTCQAKFDVVRNTCEAYSGAIPPRPGALDSLRNKIRNYAATWRVREFGISGGDTLSTFTDTTVAQVYGIASDAQGRVYVSCIVAMIDPDPNKVQTPTRNKFYRVYRYERGPRYAGVTPADANMPGASWHRDTTWQVVDGTGASSVSSPLGINLTQGAPTQLVIADRGNNEVKSVSVEQNAVPFVRIDGATTGANLDAPTSVASDLQGYLYIVDRNNKRVLRYDTIGNYVQTVNIEKNSDGLALLDPVAVGVDDSLAYVADRGRGQVLRFKRRK